MLSGPVQGINFSFIEVRNFEGHLSTDSDMPADEMTC